MRFALCVRYGGREISRGRVRDVRVSQRVEEGCALEVYRGGDESRNVAWNINQIQAEVEGVD